MVKVSKNSKIPKKGFIGRIFCRLTRKVSGSSPPGLVFVNFVVQRLLGVNNRVPWPVHFTSRVQGEIEIGNNVAKSFAVSGGCYIQGYNGIIIGEDSIFAPNVQIISGNHDMENGGWISGKPIRIGRNCWIGAGAVILPEVCLGDGCVVAAGAVVNQSFDKGSVVGGVPARLLRKTL